MADRPDPKVPPADEVAHELSLALDALEASLAAHRTLESVLLAILAHSPVTLVVTDRDCVRAASATAESTWSARTGTSIAALPEDVRGAVRAALAGHGGRDGLSTALIEELGTDERYVLVVQSN